MTKRSLIMAGGGLKVAYQAGVLQVWLDEAGLSFEHADGASGGVFNLVQYCQGSSGTEIADSWRDFPIFSSISLNWRQYLRLFAADSLMTYDAFRKHVLRARWKLNWGKIRSSRIIGTFNAYNFSKNKLETRTQDQIDEDYLLACVSLPMWFPPITIGNDRFIDAVYLTDANLLEAIARGADELWIIWKVGRKAVWKGGFIAEYFQIIETSANGRLKLDLERIEANNVAISNGGRGEFGRPIKVEMLAGDVPLHYLINFSSTRFTAAVEQGIADARVWCAARGIPLKTSAQGALLAMSFQELMQGSFALGAQEPEQAAKQASLGASTMAMHASIVIDDLDRFLNEPTHAGRLAGTIDFTPFGVGIPITAGSFNLLERTGPQVKEFIYQLQIQNRERTYFLDGHKYVRRDGELWKDTTTLHVTLHEGSDASGPVVGAGILTLGISNFIRTLGSIRVHNARTSAGSIGALERFGKFFLGELWDTYGVHIPKPN